MKKALLLLSFTIWGWAANAQKYPVPADKNKVVWVRQGKKLVDLEKTDLHTAYSSTRLTGKANFSIVADGAKSAIIRSGNPADVFIVKLDAGADPEKVIELFRFESDKDQRSIPLGEKVLGKSHAPEQEKPTLLFTKVEENVYAISPENQLDLGEYVFIVNRPKTNMSSAANGRVQTFTGYCFSVGN